VWKVLLKVRTIVVYIYYSSSSLRLEVSELALVAAETGVASGGRAGLERDALDVGAESAVLVVGDAHGVLL
jgi:hypothetical protein